MVKSKDVSVSITKGDISPQAHLYDEKATTSIDDTKEGSVDSVRKTWPNGSSISSTDEEDHIIPPVPNPFYFRMNLSTADKIKMALMTIFVVPIRVIMIILFLLLTWLGCAIGLLGYPEDQLEKKPMTGWRRKWWHPLFAAVMRQMFIWGGIQWEFKGRKATRDQAPLLIIGPHQSFLDGVIVLLTGGQSPCAKEGSKHIPLLGTVLRFIQPVFVMRNSKESRITTLNEIKSRATSDDPWSQIVIFPEGTCSNGSVLLKFKRGAFSAGVPVQPVLIRYPNKVNTLTWTWDGPGALTSMWATISRWSTKMIIEYLPVYCPSEAEKADPALYADNVRRLMAAALSVQLSSFSFDDVRFIETGDARQPHHTLPLTRMHRFRAKNELLPEKIGDDIEKISALVDAARESKRGMIVSHEELLKALQLTTTEASKELFVVLNMSENRPEQAQNSPDEIDLRYFLAALHLANGDGASAFKCLSDDGVVFHTEAAFCRLCWLVMELPTEDARTVFYHLQPNLDLESFRRFVVRQRDRCKGIAYFEPSEKLDVESSSQDPSQNGTSSDDGHKRQKAE